MEPHITQESFYDVEQYAPRLLHIFDDCIHVPVTYKNLWHDGFAARGWKVDATIGDPAIIASTRETGQKINTSVFVHDILDHFLSGFGISGHRSEAMALIQLSKRTGANPTPDFEQMIKEDILNGCVNGEKLTSFLPPALCSSLPAITDISDREIIFKLKNTFGEKRLIRIFVDHFFNIGKAGEKHAVDSWNKLRLDINRQTELGLALQNLLDKIDTSAEEKSIETMEGSIRISNQQVSFAMKNNNGFSPLENEKYSAAY